MVLKAILLISLALLFASVAEATTWYAAEGGTATNGTYASPWSVSYAVTNSSNNPHRQAGDTVLFKDGTHICTDTNGVYGVGNILNFQCHGTAGSKITFRPENLWGFRFDGGLMIESSKGASNLVISGFVIEFHGMTNRTSTNTTGYVLPPGITEDTEGNRITHNIIRNVGHPGIGTWKGTRGKYIAGNIIAFAGFDDWLSGYTGTQRGSAMYMQNATNSAEANIGGNINFFNYTTGGKAYGHSDIWGFNIHHQISHLNAEAGFFYHQDNYGSDGLIISSNVFCFNGAGIRLGYPLGNGDHSNLVADVNLVVDKGHTPGFPFYMSAGFHHSTVSNNTFVALSNRYVGTFVSGEPVALTNLHFGQNLYFATNTGAYGANPFEVTNGSMSFATWQSTFGIDADSTFSYSRPSSNTNRVFRPSDDSNFVHVAVINWSLATNETVSLSGVGINTGDTLDIYDAQNVPTVCYQTVYNGSSINLPIALTNRMEMLGTFSQRSDTWTGFDPLFRAFVIHRVASATVPTHASRFNSSARRNPPSRRR